MKTPECKPIVQPSRHRTATDQFLLSKTDAQPRKTAAEDSVPHVPPEIMAAFPHLLYGPALLEHALARLDGVPVFGAAAVALDVDLSQETASTKNETARIRFQVAKAVDQVCQAAGAFWGQLSDDLFGCFWPARAVQDCQSLADDIQQGLAQTSTATVTIGIATYPLLDYPQSQILENAIKALRHAAFFGPGSCTVFDAVSLNISGDEKYQAGDIEGAIHEFESGLRLDPANVNLHNSLGVCFGVLKQFERAWGEFDPSAGSGTAEYAA